MLQRSGGLVPGLDAKRIKINEALAVAAEKIAAVMDLNVNMPHLAESSEIGDELERAQIHLKNAMAKNRKR